MIVINQVDLFLLLILNPQPKIRKTVYSIPTPSDIEKHKKNPDYKDGTWALIEVDISKLSLKASEFKQALTIDRLP